MKHSELRLVKLVEPTEKRIETIEELFRRRRVQRDFYAVRTDCYYPEDDDWTPCGEDVTKIVRQRDERDFLDDFTDEEKAELKYPFKVVSNYIYQLHDTREEVGLEHNFEKTLPDWCGPFFQIDETNGAVVSNDPAEVRVEELEEWAKKPDFYLLCRFGDEPWSFAPSN